MHIQPTTIMASNLEKAAYRLKIPRAVFIRQVIDAKLAAEAAQKAARKPARKSEIGGEL